MGDAPLPNYSPQNEPPTQPLPNYNPADGNRVELLGGSAAIPGAPTVGTIPAAKRDKILAIIKGMNGPLSTTDPAVVTPNMRSQDPFNQGEIQRPDDPRFSQGKTFDSGYAAPNDPTDVSGVSGTRPAIVGKGPGAGRIQTMIDNPLREVNPDGSAGNVSKMSKKRAFLLGLMKGIDKAGQQQGGHTWASVIGGGAMGGGIGIASPTSIQKWQRREDVEAAQGDLSRQQALQGQAANIEETQAQAKQRAAMPAIEAAKAASDAAYKAEQIKIQQDVIAGKKTAAEAAKAQADAKMKHDSEEREKDRENARVIAGMPARGRSGASADTEPKRQAKLKEFETTKANAAIYDTNAQTASEQADAIAAEEKAVAESDPSFIPGTKVEESPRVKALRKDAESARQAAKELRAKLPGLQADADSIPAQSATTVAAGKPAPTSHGFSVKAYLSKNKGATRADAVAFAKEKYPGFEVVD
jgi:hypothetical protein